MAVPNFFQGMSAEVQIYNLIDFMDVVSGDRNDDNRGDNIVLEIVNAMQRLSCPLIYVGERDIFPAMVHHLVVVTDPAYREQWVTRVHIEATHGDDDMARKFRITLKSGSGDDVNENTRYFNSVYDFMPVLLAIALIAKERPGRPVEWSEIETMLSFAGSKDFVKPWTPRVNGPAKEVWQ